MNRMFFANIQSGTLLFNRFELVRCLYAAGYGAVYLCNDREKRGHQVALKVLAGKGLGNRRSLDNIRREMLFAGTIYHQNVVRSESFFHDEDYAAFTMEYLSGGTLADLLKKRKKRLSIGEVVDILRQLCAGLEAIHSAGVIHRDLKTDNVLMSQDGNVKIIDFGVAVAASEDELPTPRGVIGTMNYLSPEYIEHGQLDIRSDIYSLGVIAYEIITGQLPFGGDSVIHSLIHRVCYDIVPPDSQRPDCPLWLGAIVMKALSRHPGARYQSAAEMLDDLRFITARHAPQGIFAVLRERVTRGVSDFFGLFAPARA